MSKSDFLKCLMHVCKIKQNDKGMSFALNMASSNKERRTEITKQVI